MNAIAPRVSGTHAERPVGTYNGFIALVIGLALIVAGTWGFVDAVLHRALTGWGVTIDLSLLVAGIIVLCGLYTLQPNEAAIMQLFGAYRGSSRIPGLRATNPFYTRRRMSVRARNLNGERLKVNDSRGNPIEIGAVVVWHVDDTAKAAFDVDDYEKFVTIQSEAAVRHLASSFAYDSGEGLPSEPSRADESTLLGSADVVARALVKELQARLDQAGVVVEESRLTHLAYAPEIAQVMLRRQQAEAIIAARRKIVHGAVSMVEMALAELSAKNVVDLDPERRAAMVSNLMTVLCAESEVQPVINTGTLYNG
jgi:regulator of protease activity HflC (stomatin/prohibitin superfamily)